MNDFYAQYFPFLVIERWSILNEKFLNDQYQRIINKKWDFNLLDVDNFFDYFNIKKSNTHKKYQDIGKTLKSATADPGNNKLYM